MTGGLPLFLGTFPKPLTLNLSHNHLTAPLPKIFNATALNTLDLSYNQLTGAIPNSFTADPSTFFYLDLSHNRLTGAIPAAIGTWAFAWGIFLRSNSLTGVIPAE